MKRSRFSEEQIIGILADAMLDNAALEDLVGKKW